MDNEVLREMAKQCSYPNFFDVEKYTQLVVREVADKCFPYNEQAFQQILKYFNVKAQ